MPATPKNYDVSHIQQGPGDLWIIGTPPVDGATPQLTLYADGSPDATAHPNSVHLGATDSAVTIIATPKLEDIHVDQFDGAVARYLTGLSMSLEAELKQLDPQIMQNAIPFAVFTAGSTGAAINTTIATSFSAGLQTVTPAAMTNIGVGSVVTVANSNGTNTETVIVTAIAGSTFTAFFMTSKTGPGITVVGAASPGYKQLTFGNQVLPSGVAVACIAPRRAAASRFVVSLLFMAHGALGLSTTVGRSKAAMYKAKFEALADMTRSNGRTMGIVYETL